MYILLCSVKDTSTLYYWLDFLVFQSYKCENTYTHLPYSLFCYTSTPTLTSKKSVELRK